ncbi:MAG: hypothetical protein PHR45_03925 [Muribaculaceae bacterium]|nr:hypothetical protein [Muribaculaceae bacterium]
MTFFRSVKRAFGFSADEYTEEDHNLSEDTVERTPYINPFKKEEQVEIKAISEPEEATTDDESIIMPDAALQSLVELINSNQPEFVRRCIDESAQKKYLCEAMGESFKSFAQEIKEKTLAEERRQWNEYKLSVEKQINEFNENLKALKLKAEEQKNLALSSDRQRRALNDRIHDLESQVSKSEAEQEQFELENKSLLNRLKVIQVKSDDIEYFKRENERLSGELNKLRLELSKVAEASSNEEEISKFKSTIAELKATIDNLNCEKETAIEQNEVAIASLKEDINMLQTSAVEMEAQKNATVSDLKKELEISVAMVNSMRTKASELEVSLKAKEVAAVDNTQIEELKEKLRIANSENESLQEELNEYLSNLEIVQQVQEQLEKVDEMKKKKDDKINALSNTIKGKELENETLKNEVAALKLSIDERDRKYSLKMKEISAMYEAELKKAEQQKQVVAKPEIENNFDMTMLDDNDEIIPELVDVKNEIPQPTPTKKDVVAEVSEIYEAPLPAMENIEDIKDAIISEFEAEEIGVVSQPIISAISHDNDNWMRPSPPTSNQIIESEPAQEKSGEQQRKHEDNTLQMSLF